MISAMAANEEGGHNVKNPPDVRMLALEEAMEHQFDDDENAPLVHESDDPSVQAAVRLINHYCGWSEIVLNPYDAIEAMDVALGRKEQ